MMEEFSWELFCRTGALESFLLYKEITGSKKARDKGEQFFGTDTNEGADAEAERAGR
jgi:hypothetical protein